jgi:hypothetical protein
MKKHITIERDSHGLVIGAIVDNPTPPPPPPVPEPKDRFERVVKSLSPGQVYRLGNLLKVATWDFDFRESVNAHQTDDEAKKVLVKMGTQWASSQQKRAADRRFKGL